MAGRMFADERRRQDITRAEAEEMFALYETYYEATSWEVFAADLAQKDYAVLLRDSEGTRGIRGFSTVAVMRGVHDRRRYTALFSGDTVIHHQYWGEQTLPTAWLRLAGRIGVETGGGPLYWFLISKGYRTYRYLPLFSRLYYPSHAWPTPEPVKHLMDALAKQGFGACYDEVSGVVRFPESRGQLRGPWAGIKPAAIQKPDVRFFLQRNPGYRQGHELVCLAELIAGNLRPRALHAFLEGVAEHERVGAGAR